MSMKDKNVMPVNISLRMMVGRLGASRGAANPKSEQSDILHREILPNSQPAPFHSFV